MSKPAKSEPFISVGSFPPCPGDSRFLLSPLSMGIWSYSFERVPFLGSMILLLSPSLRCWYALRLCSGCFWVLPLVSYPPAWFYACLPFVSHLPLTVSEYAVGASAAWFYTFVACDGCDIGIDMARESKPGKNEIKTRCKRDPGPGRSKLPPGKSNRKDIGRLEHMKDPVPVQQQASKGLAMDAPCVVHEPFGK